MPRTTAMMLALPLRVMLWLMLRLPLALCV
jgi:hypothetical protein